MLGSIVQGLSDFFYWWIDELRGLLPMRRAKNDQAQGSSLVIAPTASKLAVYFELSGKPTLIGEFASGDDNAFDVVRIEKQRHAKAQIGLRLMNDAYLVRTVTVPRRAQSHVDEILQLDFEAATPIPATDVYLAHKVNSAVSDANGKLSIDQYAIKRSRVEYYRSALADRGLQLDFVDCWVSPDQQPLGLNFLASRVDTVRHHNFAVAATIISAAVFLWIAAGIWVVRQEIALETVRTDADNRQSKVVALDAEINKISEFANRIEVLHSRTMGLISPLRVVDELSRILPQDTWLTDMVIDEQRVEISGYARSAPSLLTLVSASPLFNAPQLTAPVMFDNRQGKDRFSLRASLGTSESQSKSGSTSDRPATGTDSQP
jgi:general secretion pathway protein L